MRRLLIIIVLQLIGIQAFSQLPSIRVQDLDGRWVQSDRVAEAGKPLLVTFWATWCKPCIRELGAINDRLPDWQKKYGLQLLAVSIDDSRSAARVAPFVSSSGWDFPVVTDLNGDMKRAMNVNNVPHTFLFDAAGKLFWQHAGYAEGDEEVMEGKLGEMGKR